MKKIAIIGAGPAGVEAASTLACHNYEVVLFERNPQPLTNLADKAYLFPNFVPANNIVSQLNEKLKHQNITLRYNTPVTDIHFEQPITSRGEQVQPIWYVNQESYDAVILATGYTPFDAHRKEELGYGIYPGVHTSLEMEGMILNNTIVNAMGTTPKRIVFLQCVGSRDEKVGNHYCSRLCCVTAVKQAIEIKRLRPEIDITIFYMDLRMWGQHFEELYRTAQQEYGIKFVRGRISEAGGTFDGRVQIKAEDTLMGQPIKMTSDILVLMVGMQASQGTRNLAEQCKICGEYGFAQSQDPHLGDNLTSKTNLFLAGTCKRPMTLTDAILDGRSAALVVISRI